MLKILSVLAMAAILSQCSTSKKDDGDATDTGTGAFEDRIGAFMVLNTTNFIYNQNIANTTVGTKNLTVNCTESGTVVITGTTSVDSSSSTNKVDLTYVFTKCRYVLSDSDTTLDGTLKNTGNWKSGSSGFTAATMTSDKISIDGYGMSGSTKTEVSKDCAATITVDGSAVSGTMCGETYSY